MVQRVESFALEEERGADNAAALLRTTFLTGTRPVRDTRVGLSSVAGLAVGGRDGPPHPLREAP